VILQTLAIPTDAWNLPEHAGLLLLILVGLVSALWFVLWRVRAGDVKRIDSQRAILDRIEAKLDSVSSDLATVSGTNAAEHKALGGRLDMVHEDLKGTIALVQTHDREIAGIKTELRLRGRAKHDIDGGVT